MKRSWPYRDPGDENSGQQECHTKMARWEPSAQLKRRKEGEAVRHSGQEGSGKERGQSGQARSQEPYLLGPTCMEKEALCRRQVSFAGQEL